MLPFEARIPWNVCPPMEQVLITGHTATTPCAAFDEVVDTESIGAKWSSSFPDWRDRTTASHPFVGRTETTAPDLVFTMPKQRELVLYLASCVLVSRTNGILDLFPIYPHCWVHKAFAVKGVKLRDLPRLRSRFVESSERIRRDWHCLSIPRIHGLVMQKQSMA